MIAVAVATVVTPIKVRTTASIKVTATMAVTVSLFAIGLYSALGSPQAVTAENDHAQGGRSSAALVSTAKSPTSVGSVASMVDGLRARLDKKPDDADGWILLARSYEHLGRNQEAASAYDRAKQLGKTDATLEGAFASAESSKDDLATDQSHAIRGRVTLSREAAALVQAQDTVFVFVKADLTQPMPLLALRKTIAELPLEYLLTDDMAMMPGTSLADFDKVVVIARVSRSGRAKDVLAGLEVSSGQVSPLASNYIELQISPDPASRSAAGNSSE